MFKSLVLCVLLWHKLHEINGHFVPTDNDDQAESKGNRDFDSAGEEIVSDYFMVKGIGAFKVHRIKLKWNAARQICNEEGGHLTVIRSTSEANIVKQLMIESSVDDAWLGLHDQFEEGDWISVLDEPIAEIGWANWSRNFHPNPDNLGGNQDCARILENDGGLDDENCDSARPFVCKISIS